MKTGQQNFEREQRRIERDAELRLLATARATADPAYVVAAAGSWLQILRMRTDRALSCARGCNRVLRGFGHAELHHCPRLDL
jgi:hypothetical protein